MSRFVYEISGFNTQKGGSEQLSERPAHTSREHLHGKMDVKFVLMFIAAENNGIVNI